MAAPRRRELARHLSADERVRASRFRLSRDRERFTAAHGVRREILALYLDVRPPELRFRHGAHGKPFLAAPAGLRFNVSHSLDSMLVAVGHHREVGVDIERLDPSLPADGIGGAGLSTRERDLVSRLNGEPRHRALLSLWTRKEAFVKADGRGVSLPLERVDVSLPGGRVAVLDETTGAWEESAAWLVQELRVGPEQVAAVAAEGRTWHVARWRWD